MGLERERVIISRKAQESIKSIFEFVKKDSSLLVAHKVRQTLITKCHGLKQFSGYANDEYLKELQGSYKSVSIWDYTIIFSLTSTEVRILNVVHTSRHPKKRLDI